MHFAAPRSMPDSYSSAATAAALAPEPEMMPERGAPLQMPAPYPVLLPPTQPSSQASLFRDVSGAPKVIPIPTLTPVRPIDREESSHPKRVARARSAPRQSPRRTSDSQQALDFNFHPAAGAEGSAMHVQAVIYCDAPVALPTHRMIAAAFDASMILVAVGVFLGIFFLSGGDIALTRANIPFFIGVVVLVALFYRSLWCLANGDSPGMRFAGLRLVDFDGRAPDRDQRGMRQLAGLLSVVSAGLGLVWALVDEESLTWHDHISKTFPTVG
jgi:uncharacterized RDD family membrane protein YckC